MSRDSDDARGVLLLTMSDLLPSQTKQRAPPPPAPAPPVVEEWLKEQSVLKGVLSPAGSNSLYAVTVAIASSVAALLVGAIFQPLTDQILLLVVLAADLALLTKALHDALLRWQRTDGRWVPTFVYLLNFLFLVFFFCGTTLALALFSSLASVSPAMTWAAAFGVVFLFFTILLFLSHVSFGLLETPVDVAAQATAWAARSAAARSDSL